MVEKYFFCIVIVVLLIYSVSLRENRFAATASAIRQIWSGKCNLLCQVSSTDCSAVSSLQGTSRYIQSIYNHAGTSHDQDCLCDSCPCALINNFLETCSPATTFYKVIIEAIMEFYNEMVKRISDLYEYCSRVLECRTTCLRQAQITRNDDYGASENFVFSDNPTAKVSKDGVNLRPKRSSIVSFKGPELHDDSTSKSDHANINTSRSKDTLKPNTSQLKSFCPKCIEKGESCVSTCPKSKK